MGSVQYNTATMTHEKTQDELLTITEVSRRLGVSPWTAYHWARSGVLPVVLLGRQDAARPTYRVSEAKLAEWVAARSSGGSQS